MSDLVYQILRPVRGCATDEQFTDTYERVEAALRLARAEALEEAARVCDDAASEPPTSIAGDVALHCAATIRALAAPPDPSA